MSTTTKQLIAKQNLFRNQYVKEHRQAPFPFIDDAKVNTISDGWMALKKAFSNILYLSLKFSIFLRSAP